MTTQQDERAELIRKLNFAADNNMMLPPAYAEAFRKAAALLQADEQVGGEAVYFTNAQGYGVPIKGKPTLEPGTMLYTRPQQAARVPLTEQEADRLIEKHAGGAEWTDDEYRSAVKMIRSVEAAHGITAQTPPPGHILCLTCDGKGYQPIVDEPEKYFQESKP